MNNTRRFPHHSLDVFGVSVEMAQQTHRLAKRIPRGHRNLADQMKRAATSTVLNITEGANRSAPRDKANRYSMARGECGEVAGALELAVALNILHAQQVDSTLDLAARVTAMLTRLIQRADE